MKNEIVTTIHKFWYTKSSKEQVGPSVPTLQESLRKSLSLPRAFIHIPRRLPELSSRFAELKLELIRVFDEHKNHPMIMTTVKRRGKSSQLEELVEIQSGQMRRLVVMSHEQDNTLSEVALSDTSTYEVVVSNTGQRVHAWKIPFAQLRNWRDRFSLS